MAPATAAAQVERLPLAAVMDSFAVPDSVGSAVRPYIEGVNFDDAVRCEPRPATGQRPAQLDCLSQIDAAEELTCRAYALFVGHGMAGVLARQNARAILRVEVRCPDQLIVVWNDERAFEVIHERPPGTSLYRHALSFGSTPHAQVKPPGSVVPVEAPDTLPAWIYDDSNIVSGSPYYSTPFLRDIIVVTFRPSANQAERQAAIDLVGGVVVGGARSPGAEGDYYVKVATADSGKTLLATAKRLNALSQVLTASLDTLIRPKSHKTDDGQRPTR
ncbi:MAG TPA: hypothetical protein VFO06_04060 [Gemmatimonadales bacterium]|nr:hypothetical protein [Gemmatimonadales bacterium]